MLTNETSNPLNYLGDKKVCRDGVVGQRALLCDASILYTFGEEQVNNVGNKQYTRQEENKLSSEKAERLSMFSS